MTERPRIVTRINPDKDASLAWEAWWSDQEEADVHHRGYGRTAQAAIHDLQRLDQERWEAEHEEEDPPWQDTDAT